MPNRDEAKRKDDKLPLVAESQIQEEVVHLGHESGWRNSSQGAQE